VGVGVQSSEAPSSIAVFDSACSRSYEEEDGYPAYRPYRLELSEELGEVCGRPKRRLDAEAAAKWTCSAPLGMAGRRGDPQEG
jgi:hypothetical protein